MSTKYMQHIHNMYKYIQNYINIQKCAFSTNYTKSNKSNITHKFWEWYMISLLGKVDLIDHS